MADRVSRLTEKQRACLRLVLKHKSSKEIARELGIGVDAVDQRIKTAMRTLGVRTRAEAAQIAAGREFVDPVAPDANHRAPSPPLGRRRLLTLLLRRLLPATRRGRFLLGACLATLFLMVFEIDEPINDMLRDQRTKLYSRRASGEFTLIAIDKRSIGEIGPTPWPREIMAELVQKLDRAQARRIIFDTHFVTRREPEGDRIFAKTLQPLQWRIVLTVEQLFDPVTGKQSTVYPLPEFRRNAEIACTSGRSNPFTNVILRIPYRCRVDDRSYPSLASVISGQSWARGYPGINWDFPIDASIDPASIPTVSAVDVLLGVVPREKIAGKDMVIGYADLSDNAGTWQTAHYGKIANVQAQILGAATLIAGMPIEPPWWATMLPAILLVAACGRWRGPFPCIAAIGGGIVAFVVLPYFVEPHRIYLETSGPLFLLIVVGTGLCWKWLSRHSAFAGRTAACS